MTGLPFADGTCYLMDPRPVTQGAYLAALDIAPLASSHPACANQAPADGPRGEEMLNPGQPGAFEPCHRTMGRGPEMPGVDLRLPWPPAGDALDDPMVCINWCDAHAYCERMGKRLCGQRGDDVPAEYDGERAADPETAEYMNACSASGRFAFPTGSTPVAFESAPEHCGEYRSFWLGDPACPNWEGPFGGLNAMGRGMEFVGPWYQSISFGFTLYAHVDTEPTAGCNLLTSAEHQQMLDLKQNELAAGLGFRCCGDYGAGP